MCEPKHQILYSQSEVLSFERCTTISIHAMLDIVESYQIITKLVSKTIAHFSCLHMALIVHTYTIVVLHCETKETQLAIV